MAQAEMTEVIRQYGITVEILSGPIEATDEDGWNHRAWDLRLRYRDPSGQLHRFRTPWRAGLGLPSTVEVGDVLLSLAINSYYADYSFEEFVAEMGYDSDSRKAYAQWEAVQSEAKRFKEWTYSDEMLTDIIEAAQDF